MTSRKIPESAVENLVSDLEGKANVSLSNLSTAGQAKFDEKANVDLNNLSTAGQAILNGKANTDASNFTATGKQNIVSFMMVDYTTGIEVPLTGVTTFTAPYDCEVCYRSGLQKGALENFTVNRATIATQQGSNDWVRSTVIFKMSKGDVLRGLNANDINRNSGLIYYRLKGR